MAGTAVRGRLTWQVGTVFDPTAAGGLARLLPQDRPPVAGRGELAPDDRPLVYVGGPTGFAETAANTLVALGHDPGRIKTERFGGTEA